MKIQTSNPSNQQHPQWAGEQDSWDCNTQASEDGDALKQMWRQPSYKEEALKNQETSLLFLFQNWHVHLLSRKEMPSRSWKLATGWFMLLQSGLNAWETPCWNWALFKAAPILACGFSMSRAKTKPNRLPASSAPMWMTFHHLWRWIVRGMDFCPQPILWSVPVEPMGVQQLHALVRIREEPDFSFTLDHSSFCENIEAVTCTTKDDKEPLTSDEMTQLRGVLGALQWRGQQTAPHLMAKIGQLQSAVSRANLETVRAANKLVRECFQTRYLSTKINQLNLDDPKDVQFVAWSDAALANRIDLSSTGGYVIAATTPEMMTGQRSPLTMIAWRSCRLPRKARSSLAAEAQAMSEADQELVFVRLAWAEFCAIDVDIARPSEAVSQIPGTVVTDAKALYDILSKRDMNSAGVGLKDKYSALEILCLLESIAKQQTSVRWVHSDAQLADHLTKPLPIGTLHKVLNEGFWTLVYDPDFTSAKRLKKSAKNENYNQDLRGMSETELDSHLPLEPDRNCWFPWSHSGPISTRQGSLLPFSSIDWWHPLRCDKQVRGRAW